MSITNLPVVSELTSEAKRSLLAILARDLLAAQPNAPFVADAEGEIFVCSVSDTSRAKAEEAMQDADPKYLDEMRDRARNPGQSFSFEEALELAADDESETDR